MFSLFFDYIKSQSQTSKVLITLCSRDYYTAAHTNTLCRGELTLNMQGMSLRLAWMTSEARTELTENSSSLQNRHQLSGWKSHVWKNIIFPFAPLTLIELHMWFNAKKMKCWLHEIQGYWNIQLFTSKLKTLRRLRRRRRQTSGGFAPAPPTSCRWPGWQPRWAATLSLPPARRGRAWSHTPPPWPSASPSSPQWV